MTSSLPNPNDSNTIVLAVSVLRFRDEYPQATEGFTRALREALKHHSGQQVLPQAGRDATMAFPIQPRSLPCPH